jgi:threonine aldolase
MQGSRQTMTPAEIKLRGNAKRVLTHHQPVDPAKALEEIAHSHYARLQTDIYYDGSAVRALEERTASLLGKPAGLFFIKGVIAQHCLLRARVEERRSPCVAIHPLSHIDYDEANGIELLHDLQPTRLGRFAPFTAADLAGVGPQLACAVVELPLRRAGYLLPTWDDLLAISAWCQEHSVPLHLDGARLWEAAAGYRRTLKEVAALADSVYVSLYKSIGGLAGCVVVGEQCLLDRMKPWKTRQGGDVFAAYPYAISALIGLDRNLPRMREFVERARSLADALQAIDGIEVYPSPPHVNAFHVMLPWPKLELEEKHRAFVRKQGIWLFNAFLEAPLPNHSVAEVVIGDAADHYSDAEAASWLQAFLQACTVR